MTAVSPREGSVTDETDGRLVAFGSWRVGRALANYNCVQTENVKGCVRPDVGGSLFHCFVLYSTHLERLLGYEDSGMLYVVAAVRILLYLICTNILFVRVPYVTTGLQDVPGFSITFSTSLLPFLGIAQQLLLTSLGLTLWESHAQSSSARELGGKLQGVEGLEVTI